MLLDTAGLLPLVAKFELEYRSDELDAPFTMRCEQNCRLARAQPCDGFGLAPPGMGRMRMRRAGRHTYGMAAN